MDTTSTSVSIVSQIKDHFPKLFVKEFVNNKLKFSPEQDNGFVEYKRTLLGADENKDIHYATQMNWRIHQNIKKKYAIYYIGVDDDGEIIGLRDDEIIKCIIRFVSISRSIDASIIGIQIIHINDRIILKIGVKNKKICNNFLVEFDP